ncbi:MAG: Hsp20/alpha crystallin family protein [Akkermansiaceae bacterium]|nr:Hsp20/alpha crystallin family protein [Akkermansiaceae bacterium]NNM28503.1 Hsp20/alpha crystallin family protein [Akkermansiaceae bacterium]
MKLSRHIQSPRFGLFSEFDDFFNRAWGESLGADRAGSLAGFHVYESDDGLVLRTDLPGFEKSDVDVSLADGVVTVHARRDDDDRHFYSEMKRSFRLPDDTDAGAIEARLDHGILELVLPKSEEAKPKTLKIEVD